MDPNQQPNPNPQPVPPEQPAGPPAPNPQQPVMPPPSPQPHGPKPEVPAEPKYSTGQLSYDPNYLESISPQAAPPTFFSGSFGKIFFVMIGLFVLAVSLIVAFSGKDNTADLQRMVVRLENFEKVTNTVHKSIISNNLKTTNSQFMVWLADARLKGQDLLDLGGVKKTDYSKEMKSSETAYAEELSAKYEDARLSARLNRVYSNSIVNEIDAFLVAFKKLAKNPSPKIREYATDAAKNVEPLQKAFEEFVDDGN